MNSRALRSLRPLAALGCAVALATTVVGCGSDSSDDSSSGLTAAQFKAKANAICKAADADERATFSQMESAASTNDKAGADAGARAGAKVIRREADAIAKLAPPAALKSDVDALISSLDDALDAIEAQGTAGVRKLADAATRTKALGLTECAN